MTKTCLLLATLLTTVSTAQTIHAALTETCFLKRETIDGLNKICVYTCPSGEAATTIKSSALCPLRMTRP